MPDNESFTLYGGEIAVATFKKLYPHRKNLSGQRFGRWLVLGCIPKIIRTGADWWCLCDCGQKKVIAASHLLRGNTRSCGCLRTEELRGIKLEEFVPPDSFEWRPIKGYEGKYWVCENGRVFSVIKRTKGVLGLSHDHRGYHKVYLRAADGFKNVSVHFLVAQAFLGDRPSKFQINHKDGIKTHNHWTNLEYVTPRQNIKHAYRIGLIKRKSKFSPTNDSEVLRLYNEGRTQKEIAAIFGVSTCPISKSLKRMEDSYGNLPSLQ